MVTLLSLLVPILVSAVLVFIASAIVHMFLGYHNRDYVAAPNEDVLRAALSHVPPGDYVLPHAGSMAAMKSPEFTAKMREGPVVLMTVRPGATPSMGKELTLWFVYCVVVSVFAGYIASRALGPGAAYPDVFRFAGTTAFAGYALAQWQNAIWYRGSPMTSLRNTFDGLIYALITAGVFGWLWPS